MRFNIWQTLYLKTLVISSMLLWLWKRRPWYPMSTYWKIRPQRSQSCVRHLFPKHGCCLWYGLYTLDINSTYVLPISEEWNKEMYVNTTYRSLMPPIALFLSFRDQFLWSMQRFNYVFFCYVSDGPGTNLIKIESNLNTCITPCHGIYIDVHSPVTNETSKLKLEI